MNEKPPIHVLGLMAKWPTPGFVKTRLAGETSPEWAASVAKAFLLDTIDRMVNIEARRILVFDPPGAQPFFSDLAGSRFVLTPQSSGDLGCRMAAFFQEVFHLGPAKAILLGVDSPTLPLPFVADAFDQLDQAELVFGPATDGGYYLVGSSGIVPPIFDNMTWSQPSVLNETISRLKDCSHRLALLPPWYDVDTLNDWRMLKGHLSAQRRAGIDPGVPNTEQLALESPW
jgi:rSAM/selenodomain-associated transferase 1